MAFRKLTEADCGQQNALVQLTTHLSSQNHAISDPGIFADSSDQLVEQFLQETRNVPQTFRMDDLMREMNEIEAQRQLLPPVPASAVKDQLLNDQWALQYIEDGKHFNVNQNQDSIWAEILDPGNPLVEENAIWSDEFLEDSERHLVQDNASQPEQEEPINESDHQYSKFMKFMKELGDEETLNPDEIGKTWAEEYVNVLPEDSKIANTWSEEHRDDLNANFWNKLQGEWKKLSEEEEPTEHPWISEFNDYYDSYNDYNFSEENPMSDVTNPLERGKQMLQQGDLPSAVLCFEVAVKKEPENSEAWQLLGISQAENEQDPNAICALKRCLELEPKNLKALMSLAVSYTNENYPRQACMTLISWLRENPQYNSLVPPDLNLSGSQHKLVQDLFIKAAQLNPTNIDYEVQCGLGVLFNLSSEYDKAVDCFRAALGVKSEDARLWNRLGATLANGSKPEEAVDAYHRALELEPGFIRARYNVGITCINLSAYREAAEHFLLALNQQARGKDVRNMEGLSQMSETIWSTLRMCISLMNRADLRPALDNRDLETLNKAFNIQDT